ncbi:MAG: FGLLP motif-containing membrane protein, partial [Acidimicrobiales bacterium]
MFRRTQEPAQRSIGGVTGGKGHASVPARFMVVVAAVFAFGLAFSTAAWAALPNPPNRGIGAVRTIFLGQTVQAKCLVETADGDMWVLNPNGPTSMWEIRGSKVIAHYSLPLAGFSPGSSECMVVGSDGNLWFVDAAASTTSNPTQHAAVVRFSVQTHTTTIFRLADATANPTGLSSGPNGIWFTETSPDDAIGFITPSGRISHLSLPGATGLTEVLALRDGDFWTDALYKNVGEQLVEENPGGGVLARVDEPSAGGPLIVGPDGHIWESYGNGVYETDGSKMKLVWNTSYNPQAMVAGSDGRLWFVSAWFGCLAPQDGFLSSDGKPTIYKAQGCANFIADGPPGLVYYAADGTDVYEVATTSAGFNVAFPTPSNSKPVSPITSLPTPGNAFSGSVRTVINVSITVAALVALTFPAQLFNNTFQENYDEIAVLARRRTRRLDKIRSRVSVPRSSRSDEVGFALVVVVGSLLAALRSPTFGFNTGSVEQFIATLLAVVISITVAYLVARWYRLRTHTDASAKLKALPAGLVVTILCVLMSRIADFQPGYLYGIIAGVVFSAELKKRQEGQLVCVTAFAVLCVSIISWLIWVPVDHAAMHSGASFILVILDEMLATVFVAGITGLVISLLPLRFMPGHDLYNWHRGAWVATFCICAFLLIEVLMRPAAGTSHSGHVAWVTAGFLFVIFGVGSFAFREFFDRHVPEDRQRLALGARVIQALWET